MEKAIYRKYMFHHLKYRCYFNQQEAYEGDEIELIEEVYNAKLLPIPWMKADFTTSKWISFAGTQSRITDNSRFVSSFFVLKGNSKTTRKWKVKCLKRGEYTLEKITLVGSDYLGGCHTSMPLTITSTLIVYPDPVESSTELLSARYVLGDTVVKNSLFPDPFMRVDIREYTEREHMNQISWTATAKEKKLMIYENQFTTTQSVSVILNMQSKEFERGSAIFPERVESCIKACAGYFYETFRRSIPVRLFANVCLSGEVQSVETPLLFGEGYVRNLLYTLALLPMTNSDDFGKYLFQIETQLGEDETIIVTSFLTDEILAFATKRNGAKILLVGQKVDNELSEVEIYSIPLLFSAKAEETQGKD